MTGDSDLPPPATYQELGHALKALELSLYWNRGADANVYRPGTDLCGYVQRVCKDPGTRRLLEKNPADYRLIREIGGLKE